MERDTKELLKKVRRIEIKARGLSRQLFSGHYHSAFKGRGMAFSEVREYQYGDDVRNIDWNVTARFNHPFIKIYEEERELTVMLLIDASASNAFGTRERQKKELVAEIAALLAFSAIANNDKVGVIFFTDKVEKFISPRKGSSHILRIIRELLAFEPKGSATNISEALRFLTNVTTKRATAFLISDFLDDGFEQPLSIASRKHDLVALQVYDYVEQGIPNMGLLRVYNPETGKSSWADTSSRELRRRFGQWWEKHQRGLESDLVKMGIDHVSLRTDQDYIKPLVNLFRMRESRF